MVTIAQITMLIMTALTYIVGGVFAAAEMAGRKAPRRARGVCLGLGIAISAALLIWHSISVMRMEGNWQPLQDNLSALLTLSVVLGVFVAYVQYHRPVPWLEWLIMPVVIMLLLLAGHFGTTKPHAYLPTTYSLLHRIAIFAGALAFMIAGVMGALYLVTDRSLKWRRTEGRHLPPRPTMFSSLERLEHLIYSAVTLGFALFSIGIVTGIAWAIGQPTRLGAHWFLYPKVILALAAWVIFGIVLHTPIAPRLRGRKNAVLSIVGLILTVAALLAALVFMPTTGGAQ